MKGDKVDRGPWSRRDVFRVGGVATAAGVMGGIVAPDAAAALLAGASERPTPSTGPQVYTRIGVRPFINLTGTHTINGGALTLPEVRDAVHEAADYAVDIDELMEKVGAILRVGYERRHPDPPPAIAPSSYCSTSRPTSFAPAMI
jgi:hypothetical protein